MSKKDQARFRALQDLGCICCNILGVYSPPDIHHILSGGRRMGNEYTIGLCPHHHRGMGKEATELFGPSLADGSKPFVDWWGTEASLLDKVNRLIDGNRLKCK